MVVAVVEAAADIEVLCIVVVVDVVMVAVVVSFNKFKVIMKV